MAAISFGEVPSNRYIRRFPNGETLPLFSGSAGLDACTYTRGSKTFQYPEEKKTIPPLAGNISLVAASESGVAQTQP